MLNKTVNNKDLPLSAMDLSSLSGEALCTAKAEKLGCCAGALDVCSGNSSARSASSMTWTDIFWLAK